jgi:hypothetical protein
MSITAFGVPKVHALGVDGRYEFERTHAIEQVEAWLDDRSARLMVLAGEVGTGKSQAAAIAIGRVWEEICSAPPFSPLRRQGFPLWLPAPLVNRHAHWDEAPGQWEAAGLLVLDDLGEEEATPKAVAMIGALLNARWGGGRRTIITTNLDGKTFVGRYNTRITDRLRDSGVDERGKPRWWITCRGASMRGRVKPTPPAVPPGCEEGDAEISDEAWAMRDATLRRMAEEAEGKRIETPPERTAEARAGGEAIDMAAAKTRLRQQLEDLKKQRGEPDAS